MPATGTLEKMRVEASSPVQYMLPVGEALLALNPLLGEQLSLHYSGQIHCSNCGQLTKKSYNQGYCYLCSQRLARCDLCVLKPELCHFDQGTCREPDWGLANCMQPHIVYLANSSGLKVGITRQSQIPTRWIDQGASQALPILRVQTRFQSGLLERALAEHVADRTDWRAMLRGVPEPMDLAARRDELLAECLATIADLRRRFGEQAVELLSDAEPLTLDYPILQYPRKLSSLNFDKTAEIQGRLQGIKGQYLIFDVGVLNIRKFTAYQVTVHC